MSDAETDDDNLDEGAPVFIENSSGAPVLVDLLAADGSLIRSTTLVPGLNALPHDTHRIEITKGSN